jgi:hypothetical protein
MLPESLARFLHTQKHNRFQGVMAAETRKE